MPRSRPIKGSSEMKIPALWMPSLHRSVAAVLGLALLTACSANDPVVPGDPAGGAAIGPDGGLITHGDIATLYVPPGAVAGDTEFTLGDAGAVPNPPAGMVQIGPALRLGSSAASFATPVALAVVPPLDPTNDPLGLSLATTRLSRLDADQWTTVPGSHSIAIVHSMTTIGTLGTFAVHADTTRGSADAVLARIDIEVEHMAPFNRGDLAWYSSVRANFTNVDGNVRYDQTGGSVTVDGGQLADNGYYHGFSRKEGRLFTSGQPVEIVVPGGSEVPPLTVVAQFVDHTSSLLAPATGGQEVPVDQDLVITWDDTGGDLVWLIAYGTGAEGFLFLGAPTPNDGEHVVASADLARFGPDVELRIFMQRLRVTPIIAPGFAPGSRVTATCRASVGVQLR